MRLDLPRSVGLLPRYAAAQFGGRKALHGAMPVSFDWFDAAVGRVSASFIAAGLQQGDRVTLYGENGWEWLAAFHGVLRAGGVVNPVNVLLTTDELGHIMSDCDSHISVVSAGGRDRLNACGRSVLVFDYSDIARIAHDGSIAECAAPHDGVASITYTSGTTGRPKGAVLSHRAIIANIALTSQIHGKTVDDHVVTALPCAHVYGAVVANAIFVSGASLELHVTFDAKEILNAVERGATMIEGVPTMYAYILRENLEERSLSSLRLCTVGGQTIPTALMGDVERRFGCPLIELWGMTELGGLGATHPWRGPRKLGSIGVPLPFLEMRIEGSGEGPGELCVRGAMVMDGYYGNPAATAQVMEDGWLRTGDIATRDEEGFYFIVDRATDVILTAGYNIYPAELERVLAAHDAVSLVAVAGIPDELKGEIPCAWVVLKQGYAADEHALLAHCRETLAPYKIPRRIVFAEDLPRTSTGKVLRRALAQTLEAI
jgi:long-chain acyl-CoA synthetase